MADTDWADIEETVRQAVITAAGMDDFTGEDGLTYQRVAFVTQSEASRFPDEADDGLLIDLSAGDPEVIGYEEEQVEYDEGTDTTTLTRSGMRRFSVVLAISTTYDKPHSARNRASKTRLNLAKDEALAVLEEGGVGLLRVSGTSLSTYENNEGRVTPVALIEATFTVRENVQEVVQHIESVTGDYVLTTPEGAEPDLPFEITVP